MSARARVLCAVLGVEKGNTSLLLSERDKVFHPYRTTQSLSA